MTLARLVLPVCAHLAEFVGTHCSWWSLCCENVCHAVRPGDLFCGDATEMLEGKVLRLNVPAVCCSGHTALVIMAARVQCALLLLQQLSQCQATHLSLCSWVVKTAESKEALGVLIVVLGVLIVAELSWPEVCTFWKCRSPLFSKSIISILWYFISTVHFTFNL